MKDGNLSSWRGYLNATERIVNDQIGSALIIEDDVDWDTHLHEQLYYLSTEALKLQTRP
jgi:hypothetical protein